LWRYPPLLLSIPLQLWDYLGKPLPIVASGSLVPVSRSITFDQKSDFSFLVSYGKSAADRYVMVCYDKRYHSLVNLLCVCPEFRFAAGRPIVRVNISGIEDAFKKYENREVNGTRVKVTLQLTDSGLVNATRAFAIFDVYTTDEGDSKDSGLFGKIASFFTGDKGEKTDENKEGEEKSEKGEEVRVNVHPSMAVFFVFFFFSPYYIGLIFFFPCLDPLSLIPD
jgi:hypothetical protein